MRRLKFDTVTGQSHILFVSNVCPFDRYSYLISRGRCFIIDAIVIFKQAYFDKTSAVCQFCEGTVLNNTTIIMK